VEFMGISIGILALICALVLLFGAQGARKILGWSVALLIITAVVVGALVWAWSKYQYGGVRTATANIATPLAILPALPPGFELDNKAGEINVMGPDKRIFTFANGTEKSAIESYMKTQFGAPGTPRADCWAKEPGPWCDYRR
jgi:hypothetical protein